MFSNRLWNLSFENVHRDEINLTGHFEEILFVTNSEIDQEKDGLSNELSDWL